VQKAQLQSTLANVEATLGPGAMRVPVAVPGVPVA
jgi:hypothetical protein